MTQAISPQHAYPRNPAVHYTRAAEATRIQFRWLCALILSFCYELPLIQLTSMDRLNPRPFDFVAVFGVLLIFFSNGNFKKASDNLIFKHWLRIVLWFSVCAVVWATLWFSWNEAGKYCIFFAGKYIEGLVCIYLVAVIPLSSRQKHMLHWMVIFGGIVVATYAIYEKSLGVTVRYVTEGKEIMRADGTLFSCLGPVYFHVATFSSVACAMTFAMTNKYTTSSKKTLLFFTALFVAWPAVFCGSRTGLVMLLVVLTTVFLYMKRTRFTLVLSFFLAIASIVSLFSSQEFVEKMTNASLSIKRLIGSEESQGGANSIWARVSVGISALAGNSNDSYQWQGVRLPIVGGGFYAVPHSVGGRIGNYRIGYGIHNSYLFPYEQAGLVGLVLSAIFFFTCIKVLRAYKGSMNSTDKEFATGAWCVFIALIPVSWIGLIFWTTNGTANLNTFLVILLVLACKPSTDGYMAPPQPAPNYPQRPRRL